DAGGPGARPLRLLGPVGLAAARPAGARFRLLAHRLVLGAGGVRAGGGVPGGGEAAARSGADDLAMAVRILLDKVLFERRMSLAELADRVGVTQANLTLLKAGKARAIRFT